MNVRIISEDDLREVIGLEADLLDPLAEGFIKLSAGEVRQPPIMRIDIPEHHGEVDIKSAYIAGLTSFAVKLSSGFFENYRRGLPSASGLMILVSAETGVPQALLLDNGYLTDLRTALAGALAADTLANRTLRAVGVLGAGAQARFQLRALRLVRDFSEVYVWSRDGARADRYAAELGNELGLPVTALGTAGEVAQRSDLVVTTTPATTPLLGPDDLHPGLHITAVGSDAESKGELEPGLLTAADLVVCDSRAQSARLGELRAALETGAVKQEDAAELGEVLAGNRAGRQNASQVSVCDLTGTGMQDTVIARLAVARLG